MQRRNHQESRGQQSIGEMADSGSAFRQETLAEGEGLVQLTSSLRKVVS